MPGEEVPELQRRRRTALPLLLLGEAPPVPCMRRRARARRQSPAVLRDVLGAGMPGVRRPGWTASADLPLRPAPAPPGAHRILRGGDGAGHHRALPRAA